MTWKSWDHGFAQAMQKREKEIAKALMRIKKVVDEEKMEVLSSSSKGNKKKMEVPSSSSTSNEEKMEVPSSSSTSNEEKMEVPSSSMNTGSVESSSTSAAITFYQQEEDEAGDSSSFTLTGVTTAAIEAQFFGLDNNRTRNVDTSAIRTETEDGNDPGHRRR
ncbi:unnamed protein product [Amoebophrya sp. A25]|nr:unnamed protein product [Amoebophrya sp. A25]|eukprot:GSA25T00023361001.1